MANLKFKTTQDIKTPESIVDQVIGQDRAVEIIKKSALQRRHVFLIGDPGTGKSMLGLALAELLPKSKLVDIVSFFNPNDENAPLIRTVPAGQGRDLVAKARFQGMAGLKNQNLLFMFGAPLLIGIISWYTWSKYIPFGTVTAAIMTSTSTVITTLILLALMLGSQMGRRGLDIKVRVPKVIVDNFGKQTAAFNDGTGAHAGALVGDVLHDPFQSGGLGTPAHERVVAGMIHKSHMGVLFIDEVATLDPSTQQELLSSMQEKKFAITGQSERSAGAMVRTEPVPCDFIMVAAGNLETLKHIHPALRSRIKGYGYEVYMKETMEDTPENRDKISIFTAQEIVKDKKIPHFTKEAVDAIIEEARKRANRKGHLTLRLRELGGIIRAAGDLAVEKKAKLVDEEHVQQALQIARSLEQQIADKYIERKKEYQVIVTEGKKIGRVNGLAVIGDTPPFSGIILPIEAEVTPGGEAKEIIATGKLGEIAKEAIKNVTAIIKKHFGEDLKRDHDIYVQFLQAHEGVEGDSASIAVATAIISAFKKLPIKQNYAMTGSLSVRGEVLPIGGVTAKVEAALEAGITHVIVPKSNLRDIVLSQAKLKKIKIIPVEMLSEVLESALEGKGKDVVVEQMRKNS